MMNPVSVGGTTQTMSNRSLAILAISAVLVLVAVAAARLVLDVPVPSMTRDPLVLAGAHPLTGILSQLGVLCWFAGAAISLFAAGLPVVGSAALFLRCTGLLSAGLALDDFFQFHDYIVPKMLGLPEKLAHLAIILAVVSWLFCFRGPILATRWPILLAALALLAGSMGFDLVLEPLFRGLGEWSALAEDGPKWLGIVFWLAYSADTAWRLADNARGEE